MTSPLLPEPLLPDPLLRIVFADGSCSYVDMLAFEALEAAWHLQAETGRDRVVTVRSIHGGTLSFKVSSLDGLVVTTAQQRERYDAQLKALSGEEPEEGEEWKHA